MRRLWTIIDSSARVATSSSMLIGVLMVMSMRSIAVLPAGAFRVAPGCGRRRSVARARRHHRVRGRRHSNLKSHTQAQPSGSLPGLPTTPKLDSCAGRTSSIEDRYEWTAVRDSTV
jgi:hypothetical protein